MVIPSSTFVQQKDVVDYVSTMLVASGVVVAKSAKRLVDVNTTTAVMSVMQLCNMLWLMHQMNFELQFRAIWLRTTLVDQLQNGSPRNPEESCGSQCAVVIVKLIVSALTKQM